MIRIPYSVRLRLGAMRRDPFELDQPLGRWLSRMIDIHLVAEEAAAEQRRRLTHWVHRSIRKALERLVPCSVEIR